MISLNTQEFLLILTKYLLNGNYIFSFIIRFDPLETLEMHSNKPKRQKLENAKHVFFRTEGSSTPLSREEEYRDNKLINKKEY
jgi:hypothetical protein